MPEPVTTFLLKLPVPTITIILSIFQIRYVRASDAGSYECQVSTVPKISKLFHLKVVIPKVCKLWMLAWIRVTSQSHLHIAKPVGVKEMVVREPFLE